MIRTSPFHSNHRKRAPSGHIVVWLLILIAIAVGLFILIGSRGLVDITPTMAKIGSVALLVALTGFAVEARSDLFGASKFALFFGAVGSLVSLLIALNMHSPPTVLYVCLAAFAAMVIASATFIIRSQYSSEGPPNILRENFEGSAIREVKGVQLLVRTQPGLVLEDSPGSFSVFAQNCWDAPRELTIRLKTDARIFVGKSGKVLYAPQTTVRLGPAEVVHITLPFVAEPDARGAFSLDFRADVTGRGGRRIRPWRAKALTRPVSPWLSLLLAPTGLMFWGGGLKIKFRVRDGDKPEVALPKTMPELLWSPDEAEMQHPAPAQS